MRSGASRKRDTEACGSPGRHVAMAASLVGKTDIRPCSPARFSSNAAAVPPGATTASRRLWRRSRWWNSTRAPRPLESMKLTELRSTTTSVPSSVPARDKASRNAAMLSTSSSPSGAMTIGSYNAGHARSHASRVPIVSSVEHEDELLLDKTVSSLVPHRSLGQPSPSRARCAHESALRPSRRAAAV